MIIQLRKEEAGGDDLREVFQVLFSVASDKDQWFLCISISRCRIEGSVGILFLSDQCKIGNWKRCKIFVVIYSVHMRRGGGGYDVLKAESEGEV